MGLETKFAGHQVLVEDADKDKPKALKMELQENYNQRPSEADVYASIDAKVERGEFVAAKQEVAALLKAYMEANKGLSPELKAYIGSDWYKTTALPKEERREEERSREAVLEAKAYNEVPAIVVGRNFPKRIINVAWGRGQEGFFKWNFRSPLPEYNDLLCLTFEQKQERGMMAVRSAQPLQGETNFQEDFYRIVKTPLQRNEEGKWLFEDKVLAAYLFAKQDIASLTEEDEVTIHLIYKYQPRDKDFGWTITKIFLPEHLQKSEQAAEEKPAEPQPNKEQDMPKAETTAEIIPDTSVKEEGSEGEGKPAVLRSYTLIVNDIPLRNGELTCRCLTNENELLYFRKSLTKMELNRLDKLVITGLVREEAFGKQFVKIEQIKLAKDEDFPETILRKSVKRLHKEDNNIFLDGEQLAARKVQLLRLKHLMMKANSSDLPVVVEEMYLYAVHIKGYEWTIASVKPVGQETESKEVSVDNEEKEVLSPKDKAKQEQALRQPWQIRVAYITKVDKVRGRVEMVYGVRKKGYISLNDFPLDSPYEGDWLGMKMLDGKEPMHEIVFNDIIRLDPNKRLPNTSKLIYKVRRGMLWYSEQDHIFKLHNAPISQELVLAMDKPKYKDYFLVEEILDYNEVKGEFAWRPIKVEKFEYLESVDEMEGHIYPMKFRQKELFQKALTNLYAITPQAKQEEEQELVEPVAKVAAAAPIKEEPKQTAEPKEAAEEAGTTMKEALRDLQSGAFFIVRPQTVSFCPQRVSQKRSCLRGKRGLSAKRRG